MHSLSRRTRTLLYHIRRVKPVKTQTWYKSVALASSNSNTHQIKSAEVFMTAMWPVNTTKRMERRKPRRSVRNAARHSARFATPAFRFYRQGFRPVRDSRQPCNAGLRLVICVFSLLALQNYTPQHC